MPKPYLMVKGENPGFPIVRVPKNIITLTSLLRMETRKCPTMSLKLLNGEKCLN